jgi:methionine-rich copper-binding protein CopC
MHALMRISLCSLVISAIWTAMVWGHVFPRHSLPKAGETLRASPERVCIWFDGALDSASCGLRVEDEKGRRVDRGDGHVADPDHNLMEVSLPALSAGTYKVIWSVVSRDGHRAQGDYSFTVKLK